MNGTVRNGRAPSGAEPNRRATRPGVVSLAGSPRRRQRGREETRRAEQASAPVHGANALQVGYADPEPADGVTIRSRRQPASRVPLQRGSRLRVAPPVPVAVPRAPFLVLVLLLVIGGVVGVLMINTKINENSFRLDDLRHQQSSLDQQEQQLSQDLAEREAPGNLAAAARKLGLVPAGTPAFIRLPDGQVLGVPQPATGTPSVTSSSGAAAGGGR